MDYRAELSVLFRHDLMILLAANTQGLTVLLVVIVILLLISFFVSGAEVAFFSLGNREINMLKTKQDAGWRRIVSLMEEPKILLASLLLANSFVNIAIIVLANFLIDQVVHLDPWVLNFFVKIVVITSFVLLFGEVLPKVWAKQNNLRFAYNSSFIVEIIHYVFKRMAAWLVTVSDGVENFVGRRTAAYSLEELDEAIDKSTTSETSEEEKNILKGIAKFGNITVKQVMRTRLDVSGVNYNLSFGELVKRIEELHYSRLPVYRENLDEVVGIIHTKDIIPYLNEGSDFDWHSLQRQPYFVHEQKMIEDLLKDFQSKRIHFAVVVDEFGGTSGIVTLEDIMEEVIGDIKDEFDDEESGNRKLDNNNYIFEGRTMIHDACKMMGLPPDTFDGVRGESDSLAGLVLELAGEFPKVNDVVTSGDFEFTVLELDRNRIKKIKIAVKSALIG